MSEAGDRDVLAFGQLVAWAWRETPPVHTNRANLLIHVLAVVGARVLDTWTVIAGVVLAAISLALQKRGHALELQPVHEFARARR